MHGMKGCQTKVAIQAKHHNAKINTWIVFLTHDKDPSQDFEIEYPNNALLFFLGPGEVMDIVGVLLSKDSQLQVGRVCAQGGHDTVGLASLFRIAIGLFENLLLIGHDRCVFAWCCFFLVKEGDKKVSGSGEMKAEVERDGQMKCLGPGFWILKG